MWFSLNKSNLHQNGVALVVVLALIVIVSSILVAFVSAMRLERSASFSYSQSMNAEMIGRGALTAIIAQLQMEMEKDALPDSKYPANPLYTNVTAANVMPQPVGTNSAMPSLIKVSSTAASFSGAVATGSLRASEVNTTVASQNGRYVSLERWNKPQFGRFPSSNAVPSWILVSRGGASPAAISFGASGSTVNNPAASNTNYVIGRFSYAIYDVGGLLDITMAGYPATLTSEELQQIKFSLAGAAAGTNVFVDQEELLSWRNPASGSSASNYINYVTNRLAKGTLNSVTAGENTFLSRQDLIAAARNGVAGLSTNALPKLTVFSREKSAPSWGPIFNAAELGGTNSATFAYKSNENIESTTPFTAAAQNPNRFTPGVRFPVSASLTSYDPEGNSFTYTVRAGDALLQRRFPLSRLSWVGPEGPQNGGTAASIQACFGLIWGPSEDPSLDGADVWKYVGPTGTAELSTIKTLSQVAAETPKREPNFFEILQAGILSGSLGVTDLLSNGTSASGYFPSTHQNSVAFQLLRIGACMIDQYDRDSYPTVIELRPTGSPGTVRYLACGEESLPNVSMVTAIMGAPAGSQTVPPVAPASTTGKSVVYLMFGLWNPSQTSGSLHDVPEVRMRVRGGIAVYSYFGSAAMASTYIGGNGETEAGYDVVLDASIPLKNAATTGVGGFRSGSLPLTVTDVDEASTNFQPTPAATGPTLVEGGRWERAYPLGGPTPSTNLVGLRLPDMEFNLGTSHPDSGSHSDSNFIFGYGSPSAASPLGTPFNVIMEFKSANGWIPYQQYAGNNTQGSWLRGGLPAKLPSLSIGYDRRYHPNTTPTLSFPNYLVTLSDETLPSRGTINGVTQQPGMFVQANYTGPAETPPGPGVIRLAAPAWERSALFLSTDPQSSRLKAWRYLRPFSQSSAEPVNMANVDAANNSTLWKTPSQDGFPLGFGGTNAQNNNKAAALSGPARFTPLATSAFFPAQLARNNNGFDFAMSQSTTNVANTLASSYVDRDGLLRIADSGIYASTNSTEGNPYALADSQRYILNRPFNSVAEVGYVFRDSPWKTLDIFTKKSGDAGLLDLFTVSRSTNLVSAGKVNLNSLNPEVFSSIMDGTISSLLTSAEIGRPSQIAESLVSFVATNRLVNKSQLATAFGPTLPDSAFANSLEEKTKARREAFLRGMIDVGQTRTWNLMIDVIAQSGRYASAAKAPSEFIVEGERRYWLHVAIDRFSGEIIDSQMELVAE